MKLMPLMIAAAVAVSSQSVYAENDKKVIYSGEPSAKTVCVSIVHDKVKTLKRSLRNAKSHPLDKPHTFFKCNDMALDEFADVQGAEKALGYLEGKFNRQTVVTTEEIVSLN